MGTPKATGRSGLVRPRSMITAGCLAWMLVAAGSASATAAQAVPADDVLATFAGSQPADEVKADHTHTHTQTPVDPATQRSDPKRGLVFTGLERVSAGICKSGIRVHGTHACSHGPDAAPADADIMKRATPLPAKRTLARLTDCSDDGSSGLRTQVIYARSSDVQNRYDTFLPSFRQWAEDADTIYNASAAETGGSRHIRFVHDSGCNITVANAVMTATGDDDFGQTIGELQRLGFNRNDRMYMVFTDATVYCGIGGLSGDEQPGPDNTSATGPNYGRIDAGCWNGGTAAHEHMHTLGGVQLSAPHSSGGWHCVDEWDLMCYSDTPNFPAMQILCPDGAHELRFDCNHDDYYSTDPPAGSYLRTHWNTANSLYLSGGAEWGYVWADQPTTYSYTPSPTYQRNSSLASNTITRQGVGAYAVRFPNLAHFGGTANVTAYGSTAHMCNVGGWGPDGGDLVLYVNCFTEAGVAADTTFTASYTAPVQNPGDIGFVWANQPSTESYTPSLTYQFNSTGATNTITRSGVGDYTVQMPGLGAITGGHVKVSGYGGNQSCKVGNWYGSGNALFAHVQCYDPTGAPVDATFTATYVRDLGVLGVLGAASGEVWADQPSSESYTPSTTYQFNSTGATNTITRTSTGSYTVSMPGLGQSNGHVQVSAYGYGSARCKVAFWSPSGGTQRIFVSCTDSAGRPVDSYFTASYTR